MSRSDTRETRPVYLTWTHPISGETVLVTECFSAAELAQRLGCSRPAVTMSCATGRGMACAGGCVAHYGELGVVGQEAREEYQKTGRTVQLRLLEPRMAPPVMPGRVDLSVLD